MSQKWNQLLNDCLISSKTDTAKQLWKWQIMTPIPKFILYLTKDKNRENSLILLFQTPSLTSHSCSTFFHLIIARRNYMPIYLKNSTLIQKQVSENILFLLVCTTFLLLMFQILTSILLLKVKNTLFIVGPLVETSQSLDLQFYVYVVLHEALLQEFHVY